MSPQKTSTDNPRVIHMQRAVGISLDSAQNVRFHFSAKVLQSPFHPFMTIHARLPAEELPSTRNVRPAHLGIIFGQRFELNRAAASRQGDGLASEIENSDFMRIAQIDRLME